MECANCNGVLGRKMCGFYEEKEYICCSSACCSAKKKEIARLNCNQLLTNTNIVISKHQEYTTNFETRIAQLTDTDKSFNDLQAMINFSKGIVKMLQFTKIIIISIRDKKGTYPALKEKYSEFMDDFMTHQPTSKGACFVAEMMKEFYEKFEHYYDILK